MTGVYYRATSVFKLVTKIEAMILFAANEFCAINLYDECQLIGMRVVLRTERKLAS